MRVFYSDDYVAISHAVDATRKPQWIADSLRHTPIPGVQLMAPSPAAEADLRQVHTPEYLRAVRDRRATCTGRNWHLSLGSWRVDGRIGQLRRDDRGSQMRALDEGMSGSLSSGELTLHRPRLPDTGARVVMVKDQKLRRASWQWTRARQGTRSHSISRCTNGPSLP